MQNPFPGNLYGVTVENNSFSGSRLGYGIAVSGASGVRILGNASSAVHTGAAVDGCSGRNAQPKAFIRDPATSSGTFQSDFATGKLLYLLGLRQ